MTTSLLDKISDIQLIREIGRVEKFVGTIIEVSGLHACIGDYCVIRSKTNMRNIRAEVVAFKDDRILLMPFSRVTGISFGDEVIKMIGQADIPVSEQLLGRVIDPFANPIDGLTDFNRQKRKALYPDPKSPLLKLRINDQLKTHSRVLDCVLPIGKGQRMGIFSGSGVGKSTLFKRLAVQIEADIKVVVMIGERGREVTELVEVLDEKKQLDRTVIVAASADQPALTRAHALFAGTAIAEYFAEQGKDVLLLADSVTRHALAQREVGLAAGEPPTLRGFPPSVFAQLPTLVERLGNFKGAGSITGIYTVLVEGDDLDEPVADNMRAILDGHVVLSRKLSDEGVYPPVDVLKSRSRIMDDILDKQALAQSDSIRKRLSEYESIRDHIEIGGYQKGTDASMDKKIEEYEKVQQWLALNDGYYDEQPGTI